jgi:hypothetical protein
MKMTINIQQLSKGLVKHELVLANNIQNKLKNVESLGALQNPQGIAKICAT